MPPIEDRIILTAGTEYETLPEALRLERPWATVALQRTASPRNDATSGAAGSEPQQDPAFARAVSRASTCRADIDDAPPLLSDVVRRLSRQNPQHVAVIDDEVPITYRELDRSADRLALVLHDRGVRRGDVVAIALERGGRFIQSALAAWRAGAAFLPLNPTHPAQWRREAVHRAHAVAIIADNPIETIPNVIQVPVDASVDQDVDILPAVSHDDLAYMIYTSGSTGEPKLVMLEHRGVAHLVRSMGSIAALTKDPVRLLQFSTPIFDAVIGDMCLALGHGGVLDIYNDELSARPLGEVLQDRQITHAILPASVVRTLRPDDCPALKVLVSQGDVCKPETAAVWASRVHFINAYGPTEATVCSSTCIVRPEQKYGTVVPIGKPMPHCHLTIMDESLHPVPDGVVGEICIGGAGVGRGYMDRPAETAIRFVADPIRMMVGERLYRTGDLGRYLPDGQVEFLGRRDRQVKVRGFRVELDEVERLLSQLPMVREAAVVAEIDGDGGHRLVGYVLPKNGTGTTPRAVRTAMELRAPRHLIPSMIRVVGGWPLTPSGKVDRARLSAATLPSTPGEAPPSTSMEERLRRIARDLLKVDQIGVHDDIFNLDANSLLAVQMIARIRTELKKVVDISTVMRGRTIAKIAQSLDDSDPRTPGPQPVSRHNSFRTPSYAQQRVWFMQELSPESIAYNAQTAIRLYGDLDREALQASLTEIVRRHEVLRSRFFVKDEDLLCEVHEPWSVQLLPLDLSDEQPADLSRLIGEAVRRCVNKPFDLTHEWPIRWQLVRIAHDEHVLIQVEHHIVHDGWTFNLLLHDMISIYADMLRYGECRAPALSVGYYDYAQWQRDWCETTEGAAQREFWRKTLADAPASPKLIGRSPKERRFLGAAPRVEIDADLAQKLEKLGSRSGCTLFMTMLAAYFVLLQRYTGTEDILVGSGLANRRWQDTEHIVGMFINTVAFRGNLAGDPTFIEMLARVRLTTLDVYDNQGLPFELILKEANVSRVPGENPLTQCWFSFDDVQHQSLEWVPLDVRCVEGMANGSAKSDINVIAIPRYIDAGCISRSPGNVVTIPASTEPVHPASHCPLAGITLQWEYNSDRFDERFIAGMIESYLELLRSAVADPDARLSELSMVTPRAQDEIIKLGTSPERREHISDTVPHLVERWADSNPDAPAVVFDGRSISYRELVDQANAGMACLRANGVSRGQIVAVCLPRSADLVTTLLAVMKTGAGYLVLDPDQPWHWRHELLVDSDASLVVTTDQLAEEFGQRQQLRVLPVDQCLRGSGSAMRFPSSCDPHDRACVIYTSGSTGKSKGVQIEHRSIVARLMDGDFMTVTADSDVLCYASIVVDMSAYEIWGALVRGATLHVLPGHQDLPTLSEYLAAHRLTHVFLPTTLFHQVVLEMPEALRDTEQVLTGGSVVSQAILDRLLQRNIRSVVIAYGPTEVTFFASLHIPRLGADEMDPAPLGTLVNNTSLFVLDGNLRPVPFGVPGEICIGGVGLARGYLARPALTAERFVPNPLTAMAGDRLYRSGDIGVWLSDGTLGFLGRRDQQVKLRGFRVELDGIRSILMTIPGVVDAVVVADGGDVEDGVHRLVGYVLQAKDARLAGLSLRATLAERLPDYLVPSTIVVLDAWPSTASGKVDRARLPRPVMERTSSPVAPRNPVEQTLAQIIAELLDVDDVGVDDNFFDLGGDSLLATKFISRARAALSVDFRLGAFLTKPTVAHLARTAAKIQRGPFPAHGQHSHARA